MTDRQDPYGPQDPYTPDPYAHERRQGRQEYTYDAYGQPVHQDTAPGQEPHYDPYGRPAAPYGDPSSYGGHDPYGGQGHGYDGHAQGYAPYGNPAPGAPPQNWVPQQAPRPPYEQTSYAPPAYEPSYEQSAYGQDAYGGAPYGEQTYAGQQYGAQGYAQPGYGDPSQGGHRPVDQEAPRAYSEEPQRHREQPPRPPEQRRPSEDAGPADAPGEPSAPGGDRGPEYQTEQFAFIEEPDEDSEDVIDWLKFTESRTERREEAKRRGRSRRVALVVLLVLLVAGGVGYLWWAGKLPGLSGPGGTAAEAGAGQKRDVLVVHLRDTRTGDSSTALLVDNETTGKGTTVLLPNNLVVTKDDGTATTLGKSVKDDGAEPTRDALGTLLGADLKASWRLDTPYLENLVETVGGISVDTDTTVPGAKKGDSPLVKPGSDRLLNGQSAVAYATYRGPGETQDKQLTRFGQVMQATLKKVSSDADGATATVKSLLQVLDPPLTEAQLGSSLAVRADLAKTGAYGTLLLPVRANGTLGPDAAGSVVKNVLGGTVKKTDPNGTPRVSVRNATGDAKAAPKAQAALVNGGYTVVSGGTADAAAAASQVTYADAADQGKAAEVAKTLGLPDTAVRKANGAANADITVVLGQDYRG
ncbi:LytR C-terminal domain-containing protein [Streptomyces benahoarensis]|uniref:LytR family transcriptional regulator n=1 Tax=Streptomyces benahoarensis TaxID=2595054 RepID=A0A553ZMX6_9ACTN|nr:LytR C-terminal domain-containing protein [Streptomyces benahoarensis]TSB24595.1 LytR family transcriptional regulator [Streptomyces benahoarensis]TSB42656.1 LytR family transcriptional regulator [Streptomyces benahoarensis]